MDEMGRVQPEPPPPGHQVPTQTTGFGVGPETQAKTGIQAAHDFQGQDRHSITSLIDVEGQPTAGMEKFDFREGPPPAGTMPDGQIPRMQPESDISGEAFAHNEGKPAFKTGFKTGSDLLTGHQPASRPDPDSSPWIFTQAQAQESGVLDHQHLAETFPGKCQGPG
jgi:hypothetical protein